MDSSKLDKMYELLSEPLGKTGRMEDMSAVTCLYDVIRLYLAYAYHTLL